MCDHVTTYVLLLGSCKNQCDKSWACPQVHNIIHEVAYILMDNNFKLYVRTSSAIRWRLEHAVYYSLALHCVNSSKGMISLVQ